jgi:enediyne core biosynthesis thioesterase
MSTVERRCFEVRHRVTFGDTNAAGSVYFARYFSWQGECRERLLAQFYPQFKEDLAQGFGMSTEYAHQDFYGEAYLFDELVMRLWVKDLTRSRIEFEFEFIREQDQALLARGTQAVVWTNQQHRPSLMPDALYEATAAYFSVEAG